VSSHQWDSQHCCWQLVGEAGEVRKQSVQAATLVAIRDLGELGEAKRPARQTSPATWASTWQTSATSWPACRGPARLSRARGSAASSPTARRHRHPLNGQQMTQLHNDLSQDLRPDSRANRDTGHWLDNIVGLLMCQLSIWAVVEKGVHIKEKTVKQSDGEVAGRVRRSGPRNSRNARRSVDKRCFLCYNVAVDERQCVLAGRTVPGRATPSRGGTSGPCPGTRARQISGFLPRRKRNTTAVGPWRPRSGAQGMRLCVVHPPHHAAGDAPSRCLGEPTARSFPAQRR
jgi:hypothetical protein